MEDSEDLDQASKRLQRLLRENHDSQDTSAAAATAEGGSVKKAPALRKKSSIYTSLSNPGKFTQIDVGSVQNTVDDYDLDQEEERKRAEQILQNMNSCFEDEGNKATSSSSVNLTNPLPVATLHTKTQITDQSKSLSNSQVLASTNQMPAIGGNAANVQPSQTTPRTKQGRNRQRRDLHKTTSGAALSNKVPTQVPTIQHPGISVPGIHLTNQHTGITFTNQHPGTAAQGMTNQYQGFSAQGMTLTNQSHAYGLANQRQPQDIGTWIKYKPTCLGAAEWIQYRLTVTQTGQGPIEICHCITAMPEYEAKSLEELRCEDYLVNRRGRQHDSPVPHISPHQQPSTAVIPSHLKYGKGLTSIKTIQTDIIPSTDSSGHMHLCESHITGSCRKHLCEFYHNSTSRLPYEWQVSLNGIWYKIIASEELEEAYCDLSYKGVQIEIVKEHEWCCIYLEFKDPTFLSHIQFSYNLQLCPVEMRRLSTLSYVLGSLIEPGFKTQWRWYWQDDSESWNLYEKVCLNTSLCANGLNGFFSNHLLNRIGIRQITPKTGFVQRVWCNTIDTMQYTLETKYLVGQKEYIFLRENEKQIQMYLIDFSQMGQMNLQTCKARHIIRRPLFVSANHIESRKIPPTLSSFPLIEVELPTDWVPWDHANDFELVKLSENSGAFENVHNKFYKSLSTRDYKIEFIYRIQNHMLWTTFCNKEKLMNSALQRKQKDETLKKMDLFHGTSNLDSVHGICTHNFDKRVSGKNAIAFGDGTYFARDASYSHRYTSGSGEQRYMFLAQVIVGKYTEGKSSYRRPPELPGSKLEMYDSCVDNTKDPAIYILFDSSQHYPAFLIQYKKI